MALKKSWTDKFQQDKKPVVKFIDFPFAGIPANSNMLIATPALIDEYVNKIPPGRTVTIETLRKDLAIEQGADFTCPVTTAIYLRIVAEAAYERYEKSKLKKGTTPYWRIVDPESTLAKKLVCGKMFIVEQRKREKIS